MTIMYLTVLFLLAALAVSGVARVRGLEFSHGGNPVDAAAILLVTGLVIDLIAQVIIGSQGWLTNEAGWARKAPGWWLWKIGLGTQGLAVLFLVLGIWRLFAAVGQLQPAGKPRASRPAPAPVADDAE